MDLKRWDKPRLWHSFVSQDGFLCKYLFTSSGSNGTQKYLELESESLLQNNNKEIEE